MNEKINTCSYSIYIRTLGKGGEKYKRLLQSIDIQTVRPQEVVVVLPEGYKPPEERLGYERFAFSEKGMIMQRIFAINDAKTPYVLLLDDDVEFEPEFVEKLYSTMTSANADCCIAKMKNDAEDSSKIKRLIFHSIGSTVYKNTHDQFFYKINLCGGYVVNKDYDHSKPVYSQTGHGSHCFAETKALKDIHFEDELWLEDSGYALPDDQVMFYKLYLKGHSIAVCLDTYFCHLDAASTNDGRRYLKIAQAKAGNFLIFWYRFIFTQIRGCKKYRSLILATGRIFMECLLYILKCHNMAVIKSTYKGLTFGLHYIKTHPKIKL